MPDIKSLKNIELDIDERVKKQNLAVYYQKPLTLLSEF